MAVVAADRMERPDVEATLEVMARITGDAPAPRAEAEGWGELAAWDKERRQQKKYTSAIERGGTRRLRGPKHVWRGSQG